MREPALAAEAHPLDRYVERAVDGAFPGARIVYVHRRYDGAFLPFQHLAVATGLGAMSDGHLVIHPIYGPWFALRAVITVPAVEPPPVRAPIAKPCACSPACAAALEAAETTDSWRAWLAVRDACSLRAWRYSDEQIQFHYAGAWSAAREPRS
jgi:epoxyqueuosine reductase QueG